MSSDVPHEWARVHPLSPVVRLGRAGAVLLIAVLSRGLSTLGSGHGSGEPPWYDIGAAAVVVVGGLVSWLVTRWRVHGDELQIETGLLRRQSIRVPLRRIQAVDVVQPLLARMFSLAELNVVVAGGGHDSSRLAYLTHARALEVRAELLVLAGRDAADEPAVVGVPTTPAAPDPRQADRWERPILEVDTGRFLAATLLAGPTLVALALIAGLLVTAVVDLDAAEVAAPSALPVLLGVAALQWRRFSSEFAMRVLSTPRGVRLDSGLLQTRNETIPLSRVQAVRVVRPLLWRPWDWWRLEVDVARQRGRRRDESGGAVTTALLPVGTFREVLTVLVLVLPGAVPVPPPGSGPPRRARWRAPLSWHYLAAWYDGTYLGARTGRVTPTTMLVPLAKVQSLRLTQGPWSRRLRLASLAGDTAGHHWRADLLFRDAGEVEALLARLADLARAARERSASGVLL